MFATALNLALGRTNGVPSAFRNIGAPASATRGVNFLTGQYWRTSLKSMSRNLSAYQQSDSGMWASFPINTLRRSDGVGALIETARTNEIRNNSMQGAVAGTSGTLPTNWASANFAGLTRTIVGVGTSNGIEYIDLRYAGTISNSSGGQMGFDGTTQIIATTGQTWAHSVWLALVGGSLTNVTAIRVIITERTSAGASVKDQSGSDIKGSLTASLQRLSHIATLDGGATTARVQPRVSVSMTSGAAIDFTIRIGWPQLEQASTVSSPIRTTAAAVTRPIDAPVFAASGTHNWTVLYDNDTTETFSGVSGDWTIDAAQLDRSTVKAVWAVPA